jgi:hypothetical protein
MLREGPIQKSFMAIMTRFNAVTLIQLAAISYKVDRDKLTKDHLRSARRAIKLLIENGAVVEAAYRAKDGQKQYSLVTGAKKREPKRTLRKAGLTIVK